MEVDEDVSAQAGQVKDPPSKDGDKDQGKSDLAEARKEIERLRKSNETLTESERYWAERAQGGGGDPDDNIDDVPEPKKKPAKTDDDEDDPQKFVDELSEKGPAAIDRYLKKKGYVPREEVEQLVDKKVKSERQAITQDAELISRFPDLKDPKSEMFEATAKEFRAMQKRDPALAKSPAALMVAAEMAELRMGREEKTGGKGNREERIRSQQGDRGRGTGGRSEIEDHDDELGPQTREVIGMMQRFGVTEESFRESRKSLNGRREI